MRHETTAMLLLNGWSWSSERVLRVLSQHSTLAESAGPPSAATLAFLLRPDENLGRIRVRVTVRARVRVRVRVRARARATVGLGSPYPYPDPYP